MAKTAELDIESQEFVAGLTKFLKAKSSRVSPIQLAQLAGLAFHLTFTGTRREDKLANALARGLSVRERMAAEEGGSMSADETARYLGVTKQSVLNMYHAGKLLAWRTEKQGAFRFPVWQFDEHRRLGGDGSRKPAGEPLLRPGERPESHALAASVLGSWLEAESRRFRTAVRNLLLSAFTVAAGVILVTGAR